jgi:hypothetical protein
MYFTALKMQRKNAIKSGSKAKKEKKLFDNLNLFQLYNFENLGR